MLISICGAVNAFPLPLSGYSDVGIINSVSHRASFASNGLYVIIELKTSSVETYPTQILCELLGADTYSAFKVLAVLTNLKDEFLVYWIENNEIVYSALNAEQCFVLIQAYIDSRSDASKQRNSSKFGNSVFQKQSKLIERKKRPLTPPNEGGEEVEDENDDEEDAETEKKEEKENEHKQK